MTAGDLSFDGGTCFYAYRGKGGKTGRRELPRPALDALRAGLAAYGHQLEDMSPHESLWPSPAATGGEGLRSATFLVVSGSIWRKPVFLRLVYTFSVTARPSLGETPGRASRTCPASWTTVRLR